MSRKAEREDVAAALTEALRSADRRIMPPPGLWERVREPAAAPLPVDPGPARGPWGYRLVLAAVAAVVCVIAAGTWWLTRPPGRPPAAVSPSVTVTVYNAEAPCRSLRTQECALRLARDPYAKYAASGNSVGQVWHGDRLAASCVVTDGTLVQDESGITSTRWYLVTAPRGARGWLPGVRTRNTTEVRDCTAAEVSANR